MGPAEIVASLKELCAEKGPRLGTDEIVSWIERIGGYESNAELIAFAKKMKARQYARMVEFEDRNQACGSSGSGASTIRRRDGASTRTSSSCRKTSASG